MTIKKIILLFVTLATIYSCSDDPIQTEETTNVTEPFLGVWQYYSISNTLVTVPPDKILFEFKENNVFYEYRTYNNEERTGTWHFNKDRHKLTIIGDTDTETVYDIISISDKEMRLSTSFLKPHIKISVVLKKNNN